ncbi:hypothetical protein DFS34DRAFT_609126 [Phlyctochytrium arcticum]|nr:hypothetical protein DFS34DRAFT_609126 [Phlyctochytrium arcticum]
MEHNVGRQQLTSSGTLSGHHDPHPPNHQQRQPNESIFHQKQSHPPHNINTNNAYGVQYNDPWAPFSGNFLSPALPTSTTNPTTASSERAPMSHEMDLGLSPSEASTRTNSSESSDSSALPREAGNEEDDDGFRMVGASTAAESFYAALNHVPAASMSADDGRNETKIDASIASFNVLSELDAALRDADLRATLSGRASGSSTTTTTTMTAKTTGAAMRSSGSSAMDELAILDGGGGVVTSLSLGAAEMPGSSVGNGSVDQWIMMQQSYHGEPYPSPPLPVPNHSIPYLGQPSLPLSNNEGSTMASAMSSSSSFETMSAAAVLVGGAVVASSMLQQQQQHVATNRPSAADVLEARKVQRSDSGSRRRRGGESRSIQEGTHRRHHSSSSSSTSSSHHPHNHHPYASVETHEGSSSSKINRSRSRSKYPAAYSNDKSPRHASSSPHKHNHNNHHRPSDPPSSSSSSTLTTPTTHHEGKRRSSSHPTTSGEGDNTTQTVRKSYPCTVCDKIFNRLYNQQQHLLIVHAPVRQKLFACPHPDCSKSYYRAADLQRHRRMHGSSSGGT